MRYFNLFVILGLLLSGSAIAQLPQTGAGKVVGGVGPTCSNSLDFSDACNSQYLVLFGGFQ